MKRARVALMLALFLLIACAATAESIVNAEATARVLVNGEELRVYETAVSHQRFWTETPELSTTPVAIAVCEGPYEVEVAFLSAQVDSAVVRPLSLGVTPSVEGGRVRFALDEPANVTVEYNGQVEGALHLFIDTPDEDKPAADDANVQYFGPGEYRDVLITPRSGQTIYIDEGAVVYGQIFSGLGKNFTIAGHGVLCGSIYDRYEDTIVPVSLTNCSDFTVRDITILDPSAWTLNLYKCKNATVDNVKIVSARSNGDGVTMQDCSGITVQNCFIRTWDDSQVVKNYTGVSSDITFQNNVVWTDLAQSCEIGYETRGKTLDHVTFRDITVLHNFHKPVISIHNSDQAAVSHVLFERIVVEDAQMGEGDGWPYLIDLTTTESQWSTSVRRGTIDDVTIRDVQVLSGKRAGIRIWSSDETGVIDNVTISGLTILGEPVTGFEQIDYESSPFNGENIRFGG